MKLITFCMILMGASEVFAYGSSVSGRYQLVQLSQMRSDQMLLDTATGKIWEKVCAVNSGSLGQCDYGFWQPVDVEGLTASPKEILQHAASVKNGLDKKEESK